MAYPQRKLTRFERFIAAGERARTRKHANPMPMLPTGGGKEMTSHDVAMVYGVAWVIGLISLLLEGLGWITLA